MASRIAAALAAAGMAAGAAPGLSSSCGTTLMGTTFDLSPLWLKDLSSSYSVQDYRSPDTEYFFNVCGDVVPPSTNPANACLSNFRVNNSQPASAWQVENYRNSNTDDCYRLGSQAAQGWNFSVYDPAYPDRGVVLTYFGGDATWCPRGVKRSLSLQIVCAALAPGPAGYSLVAAQETSSCAYQVTLPSIAGCPTQCLTGPLQVCSGNGVCGYNTDAGRSQCYCYSGYAGATCGSAAPTPAAISTEGVLLIIVCVALVAVVALTVYMVLRLRRLNVAADAYGSLEGKFNELGQMA